MTKSTVALTWANQTIIMIHMIVNRTFQVVTEEVNYCVSQEVPKWDVRRLTHEIFQDNDEDVDMTCSTT